MSSRTRAMPDEFYAYLQHTWLRESALQQRLRAETRDLGDSAGMQISPEQGQLMSLLVELTGARKILEIGTFTGYSGLAMALALPDDGHLIACDVHAEWTAIAQRYWREAGVDRKIDLKLAPALETITELLAGDQAESFDLIFLDADKTNYDAYYERALELLKPGGLILIDNVFWGGRVAEAEQTEPSTVAIRALNVKLRADERITLAVAPIGDGLTLARKRP